MADQTQRPKPSSITWAINMFYQIWHIALQLPTRYKTVNNISQWIIKTGKWSTEVPLWSFIKSQCSAGMIVNHRLHRSPAHWSTAPARHHYLHRSACLPKWPHGHRLLSNFGKTVPMSLLRLGGCMITFRGFFSRFHFVKVGKSHTSNMSQSHHKQGQREYVEQTRDKFLAAMALKAAKACQVDWIFTTNCNWSFQRGKHHAGAACWRFLWFFVPKNVADLLFGALFWLCHFPTKAVCQNGTQQGIRLNNSWW